MIALSNDRQNISVYEGNFHSFIDLFVILSNQNRFYDFRPLIFDWVKDKNLIERQLFFTPQKPTLLPPIITQNKIQQQRLQSTKTRCMRVPKLKDQTKYNNLQQLKAERSKIYS